jgi:hypothetical protein
VMGFSSMYSPPCRMWIMKASSAARSIETSLVLVGASADVVGGTGVALLGWVGIGVPGLEESIPLSRAAG